MAGLRFGRVRVLTVLVLVVPWLLLWSAGPVSGAGVGGAGVGGADADGSGVGGAGVGGAGAVVRYGWPVGPPHPVLRPFVAPAGPYGPGHRGVDLGAPLDAPVFAAADGVVSFAGPVAGIGVVSVRHPDGLRTTYLPVAPTVHRGDRVRGGDLIGHLRPGHDCGAQAGPLTGPGVGAGARCLHWGALRGDEYLDPLGLLAHGRVRLLPWREP